MAVAAVGKREREIRVATVRKCFFFFFGMCQKRDSINFKTQNVAIKLQKESIFFFFPS